jgi:hypothetical protein
MTAGLADYRDSIDAILATAVDSSTWTTAIKDQALRTALAEYDEHFAYESSLTVSSTGRAQDISALAGLKDVLAVAYPWTDGADFATRQQRWRYVADQTIYFESVEPQSGEVMRVRYTQGHTLESLDSAAATTVPDRHQQLLATLAASYACVLRLRQVSENPAIPEQAAEVLHGVSRRLGDAAALLFTRARTTEPAAWKEIGL